MEYESALDRFRDCIVPTEHLEKLEEFVDFKRVLTGKMPDALNECNSAITKAFGEVPPSFAKRMESELRGRKNPVVLQRLITALKIVMIFGLKFLSEDPLWKECGSDEVGQFNDPNNPRAIIALRKYIATIANKIISGPMRGELDLKAEEELHREGWRLRDLENPEIVSNCVVSGARMAAGVAQAIGWDNVLLSNMVENCTGESARHIDTIITNQNPMAWELIDTYHSRLFCLASALPLLYKDAKRISARGGIVDAELTESISVLTGLPRRSLLTDPLTGLTVVNLHHACLPVEGESITDTHKLLMTAGYSISPELFDHWNGKTR